jgi:hypothetical protein
MTTIGEFKPKNGHTRMIKSKANPLKRFVHIRNIINIEVNSLTHSSFMISFYLVCVEVLRSHLQASIPKISRKFIIFSL